MRYRKKPVVIEAVQYNGENVKEILDFCRDALHIREGIIQILTLEGAMTAAKGDWIIKGIKGEFYPCKPDVFADSYDLEEACTGAPGGVALGAKTGEEVGTK